MAYDIRTRHENLEEAIRAALDGYRKSTWHSLPVTVSKDSDGKTTTLQSNIKAQVKQLDGSIQQIVISLFDDVPISFIGGGGVTSTHPVKKGDEGQSLHHSGQLDQWFEQSGQQLATDRRSHSLSDAVYLPSVRSKPRALKWISTKAHHTRSDDAKHTFEMHPQNGHHFKSVDKDDKSADKDADDETKGPFNKAKKYYESIIKAASGILHNAVDNNTTHTTSLTHSDGHLVSINNGKHKIAVHPSNGISHN